MPGKKNDKTTLPPFEEWLAPWERDKDGNKFDEPAEIDAERLKKLLYNLTADKVGLQEKLDTAETERDEAKDALAEAQRKSESDEERRKREETERENRYKALEAKERERDKVEALLTHFEDQGITAKQAKALAKRVVGDDERAWLEDADELVENGFRVGSTKQVQADDDEGDGDDGDDGFSVKPRVNVRRSNGEPVRERGNAKGKSPREELEAAGIFKDSY